jgi:ABC-type dipeptide/oligopeptide/nickel transport system permease component
MPGAGPAPAPAPAREVSRDRARALFWVRLVARRLVWGLVVLVAIATATFFLTHYVPSDPAVYLAGPTATARTVAKIRHEFGLNRSIFVQYGKYMANLAHGDLGISLFTKRPVLNDIADTLPVTLGLIVPAFFIYVCLSVVLGFAAAYRRRSTSALIRFLTMFVSAAPVYWVALVLQFFFYSKLHIFPNGGQLAITDAGPTTITHCAWFDSLITLDFSDFFSALWHLVLPMTTVVLGLLAVGTRLMAGAVEEELGKHYVRTARGKGLPERKIMLKHILRATINPFVTVTGVQFGYLITYAILVEVVFSWPGIGYYLYKSIQINDYAPLIGVSLVAAIGFILISFISDVIYHIVDPRIEIT